MNLLLIMQFHLTTIVFLLLVFHLANVETQRRPKIPGFPRRRIRFWRRGLNFGSRIPTGVINPTQLQARNNCPIGSTYMGQCVSNLCVYGAVCTSGSCCAFATTSSANGNSAGGKTCPTCNSCCNNRACPTCPKCNDCCADVTCPKCNDCCPTSQPQTECPTLPPTCPTDKMKDGECSNGQCTNPASFCVNNICCTSCPIGFSGGVCKTYHDCNTDPDIPFPSYICLNGQCCPICEFGIPKGLCSEDCGKEEDGYKCNMENGLCCPYCTGSMLKACGPGGQCWAEGYTCNTKNDVCCVTCTSGAFPRGSCEDSSKPCEDGYKCQGEDILCCPACDNGMLPLSICGLDGTCEPGTHCQQDKNICCPVCSGIPYAVPTGTCTTAAQCASAGASDAEKNAYECSTISKQCCPSCSEYGGGGTPQQCIEDADCTEGIAGSPQICHPFNKYCCYSS